jgi:predicted flap endonuclease-1-like 5' DNA nuclease
MGHLTDDMTRLCDEIGVLQTNIKCGMAGIRSDVAEIRSSFEKNRKEMAREAKAERIRAIGDLANYVADLAAGVAEMRIGFRNAHNDMAEKSKTERAEFVFDLQNSVSTLRETVAGMRQKFIDDIEGARRAWAGSSHDKRRARENAVTTQRSAATEVKVPANEQVEELVADDFTVISGIGPGRMQRLNGAGLVTFAQLAECTPEDLQQILGKLLTMDGAEQWIARAKELAGS